MNKEEIEEIKDFTIDINDIDELALGLEVCSKKSNMVIQEFIDTIFQLQKENKILRENAEHNDKVVDKLNWENQELKKQLEEKNKPQIFIDTQDIEERYAEGLYQDYLEEENKKLKAIEKENQRINGELREENKRLYKTIEELSQYEYDRKEEDMMNYIIEQEEVFNDYSFMEE